MTSLFNTKVYLLLGVLRAVVAMHLALLLTGCAPFEPDERSVNALSPDLRGRFEQGRYYDPTGIFSLIVPKSYLDIVHEDPSYKDGRARVIFGNCSLGIAMSIYVETFSDEDNLEEMQKNEPTMEAMLEYLYHQVSLPSLSKHHGMELQVEHQEIFSSKTKGLGYFALVKMPASLNVLYSDERHLDFYMGHLLFFDGQQLVILVRFP